MKPKDAEYGLTQERLKSLLDYDPDVGVFRWKWRVSTKVPRDLTAGIKYPRGYIGIRIDGRRYHAHRLAWFYVHGVWPTLDIDHIDGDPSNNRLANLREATRSQNLANLHKRRGNAKYPKGVYKRGGNKGDWGYGVQIKDGDTYLKFGRYDTPEEAHEMYCEAAVMLHGEFATFW